MKKKVNIDGAQNVEVSKSIPSEKTPQEQLAFMETYTKAHKDSKGMDKARREITCLKTIFPVLFRSMERDDLLAGLDPMDGKRKSGPVEIPDCSKFKTFEELYGKHKELLDYYFDLSI